MLWTGKTEEPLGLMKDTSTLWLCGRRKVGARLEVTQDHDWVGGKGTEMRGERWGNEVSQLKELRRK